MKELFYKTFLSYYFLIFSHSLSFGEGCGEADSLFLSGKYYPAAVEYERTAFLSVNNSGRTIALLKKAECYKQMENFSEAEKSTERIIYTNLSDTLLAEAREQSALCAYLAGDFSNAENHLVQMHAFVKDSSLIKNTLPLYALVLNELQRWNEAKEKIFRAVELSELSQQEKDALKKSLEQLYAPQNYPHLKKLLKAQKMSAFLPGLGQLYAGYFWEGAASAFLNVASLGLTGYFIYAKLYFTAATLGTGMFSKFYLGGSRRLEYLVAKKNYKLLRGYNDEMKKFILSLK
ncbi:MAG: hypothetical protein HY063_07080 [Bacteroidetes bacterium]|nr:hypothetical protein [Bacteroidota bacterium]